MVRLSIAALGLCLSGATLAAAQTPPAGAVPACQKHAEIMRMLIQKLAEAPTALGLQANGDLIQVFASKDGLTWTIVTTQPNGVSCIVALGQRWESVPDPLTEPLA